MEEGLRGEGCSWLRLPIVGKCSLCLNSLLLAQQTKEADDDGTIKENEEGNKPVWRKEKGAQKKPNAKAHNGATALNHLALGSPFSAAKIKLFASIR